MTQHKTPGNKHVVILIEDDAVLQAMFKESLETDGFKVTTASDGRQGLELVIKEKPQIVLLDMLMPSLNGLDFLREFDAKNHPETKIIVFSNLSSPEQVQESLDLGAVKYIIKSDISLSELTKLLESL